MFYLLLWKSFFCRTSTYGTDSVMTYSILTSDVWCLYQLIITNNVTLQLFFFLNSNDCIPAFASLPRIPRTPDTTVIHNSAHRDRSLAPQFSQSEPQQSSRPGSTGGGGSGGRHMLRVKKPTPATSQYWLVSTGYFIHSASHFGGQPAMM